MQDKKPQQLYRVTWSQPCQSWLLNPSQWLTQEELPDEMDLTQAQEVLIRIMTK